MIETSDEARRQPTVGGEDAERIDVETADEVIEPPIETFRGGDKECGQCGCGAAGVEIDWSPISSFLKEGERTRSQLAPGAAPTIDEI